MVENVAGTFEHVAAANFVLAFCGNEMYVIKSRSPNFERSTPPRKPDLVIGVYAFPEPHVALIPLREKC